MRKGFLYPVAIMDWHSRKVLSRRLSNTMEADFCVPALEEALANHGNPDIFNTDRGSQFTSVAFTTVLRERAIRISMDGRGRWSDNVFIERLWRSLKYENVYAPPLDFCHRQPCVCIAFPCFFLLWESMVRQFPKTHPTLPMILYPSVCPCWRKA
jgi:transposase InsO family protein